MAIDYTKYPLPRTRRHVSANQYVPHSQLRVNLDYYPPLIERCAWDELFSHAQTPLQAPSYLDIGCGMGKFLLETAQNEPSVNVLGLEVRKYAVEWIQGVIEGESIGNAACLWYNVTNGMQFIESASIERIFYFFPDPWFKRRHFVRRAFTAAFLDECARVLKPDGTFYLMTDVPAVDEYQRTTLAKHGKFSFAYSESDDDWGLSVKTDQEVFSIRKNIPYTRMKCRLL